ncbi:hypothetical protein [Streptomyces poriticola]|uniref:hypothetical protein n=1 Tax=Streptomyces poriticola TaxID=3120506 RepID=UPI002FCE1FC6
MGLAASMASGVSSRLKLFPLTLDLTRALRISQAPAGVRPDTGNTTKDLLSRVRARFPGLAVLSEATHVELGETLAEAGFPSPLRPGPAPVRAAAAGRRGRSAAAVVLGGDAGAASAVTRGTCPWSARWQAGTAVAVLRPTPPLKP